uniref:THAP-type domain-containing protein n=1 Tax=Heliothis virescens TaxID=7102 RepID=A0A2A4J986_HELVI
MPKKRGIYYQCDVPKCINSSRSKPNIVYFELPNDVERRNEWLELIDRTELMNEPVKNFYVCEEHFHVRDVVYGKHRTLTATALPALHLPQQPQPELEPKVEPDLLETLKTEVKTEIKSEIVDDNEPEEILPDFTRKIRSVSPSPGCSKNEKVGESHEENSVVVIENRTFQKLCSTILPKGLSDLTKAHCSIKRLLEDKNKHKSSQKFCSNLFLSSPRVYRLIHTILDLPSPKTLKFAPITTHFTSDMVKMFANKIKTMTDQEKECTVLTRTVSLKTSLFYSLSEDKIIGFQEIDGTRTADLAVRAHVIMVRGVFADWEQPVGYSLLSKDENYVRLNEWIDRVLEMLVAIGFKIRTFVSDTGDEFIKAAENRSVTIEKPYFFIGGRKIYYIFDAPHLFLMARDHFQLYDFAYEDRVAKYEYVKQFYENDKNNEFKNAPKLKKNHIFPTTLAKMNIKYAAELFSNSVAIGISNYISFGKIDCYASDTAEFINIMNNLFDCLNSSDLKDNHCEFKNAFRGNQSQIEFFQEMLIYFQKLKLVHPTDGSDFTHQAKFITAFQKTITSILLLFEDLKLDGYTYLLTRRLNLEVLDQLVGQIRTNTRMKSAPTSWQFVVAFRKYFYLYSIKPLRRRYTAEEFSEFLAETRKVNILLANSASASAQNNTASLIEERSITCSDYNQFEVPVDNCHFLVSYYLLMKCAETHVCGLFQFYCMPHILNPHFSKAVDQYKHYYAYNNANPGSLKVIPSDAFVQFVKNMDVTLVTCLKRVLLSNNLTVSLSAKLKGLNFNQPCPCFPKDYLINLFIRFRLYNILKFNNQQFRSSQDDNKTMIIDCL